MRAIRPATRFLLDNKRNVTGAGLTGGLLGLVISFLVAAMLREISDNQVFAITFGIFFLALGLAIIKRIIVSSAWKDGGKISRFCLALFALVILMASISCFIVDHNRLKLSPGQRIPFNIFLGIAVSFAITFALVDVLNLIVPVVHTTKQLYLILGSSATMGFFFGLIFGLLDVEDNPSFRHALIKDERYSGPIGFLLGAVTGIVSYRVQHNDHGYTIVTSVPIPSSYDDGL